MVISSSLLTDIEMFTPLRKETIAEIATHLVIREYPQGGLILLEGEPCTAIYFIAAGEVCVFRTAPDGREQILVRIGKGQAFNTVPPLHPNGENQASVRSLTPVTLYLLQKDEYINLLQTYPDFCFVILQSLADRLVHLNRLVERLSLHSVRGRLASFLLEQAHRGQISRRWTQDEIAEYLGTVRDVIGRTMRSLLDEGIIRRERHKIILVNRAALEDAAKS